MPSLVSIGLQIKEKQSGYNICLYGTKIAQPEFNNYLKSYIYFSHLFKVIHLILDLLGALMIRLTRTQ